MKQTKRRLFAICAIAALAVSQPSPASACTDNWDCPHGGWWLDLLDWINWIEWQNEPPPPYPQDFDYA